MKAVVQRVRTARVIVLGEVVSEIGSGLLVFLGVGRNDSSSDVRYIARKISTIRIFEESPGDVMSSGHEKKIKKNKKASSKDSSMKTGRGRMSQSVVEAKGEVLVVSQFTLYGDCHKGRRPSFIDAAPSSVAKSLYAEVIAWLRAENLPVKTGVFQADMDIQLVNDGPVTILLDSERPL